MPTTRDERLDDASLWYSHQYSEPSEYTLRLDSAMRDELVAAAHAAEANNIDPVELTSENFALPVTQPLLDAVMEILEVGRGFLVLRGIPVEHLTERGRSLVIAGISRQLGTLISQSVYRNKIETITDHQQPLDELSRGYSDTRGLPFHTDGADYVALLCVGGAAKGGESLLVSGAAAYEAMRRERPDLLAVLKRGLFHHRRGEQSENEPTVLPDRQPVFRIVDGRMHVFYNRNAPEWLAREGIAVTEEETHAQDYLDAIFQRPEIQLRMTLKPGDLQFLNNYTILHARKPYRDSTSTRRYMLRTWILSHSPLRCGPNIIDVYAPLESRFRGKRMEQT